MAKSYDTGIVKNVENFAAYVSYCESIGVKYAPSNALIFLPALQAMETALRAALDDHIDKDHKLSMAQAMRTSIFKPLKAKATKIMQAMESAGVDEGIMKDAMTYQRLIQGRRANNSKPDAPKEGEQVDDHGRSVSRQSFISLAENFEKLVRLAIAQPEYNPNEESFKAAALLAYVAELKNQNKLVAKAEQVEGESRGVRNAVMYNNPDSMWKMLDKLKPYLAYVADQTSPAYKDLAKLVFRAL